MKIQTAILDANLSVKQILIVFCDRVESAKFGYMGVMEINYDNGECIEVNHLENTIEIYDTSTDIFTKYYWWSGAQEWKTYSK